jgi:hypothetical protein
VERIAVFENTRLDHGGLLRKSHSNDSRTMGERFQFDPSQLRGKINFDDARVLEGECFDLRVSGEAESSILRRDGQLKNAEVPTSDTLGLSSTRLSLRRNANMLGEIFRTKDRRSNVTETSPLPLNTPPPSWAPGWKQARSMLPRVLVSAEAFSLLLGKVTTMSNVSYSFSCFEASPNRKHEEYLFASD